MRAAPLLLAGSALLTAACGARAPAPAPPPPASGPAPTAQGAQADEAAAHEAFDAAFVLRLEGRELEAAQAFRDVAAHHPDTRAGRAAASANDTSATTALMTVMAASAVTAFTTYRATAATAEADQNLELLQQALYSAPTGTVPSSTKPAPNAGFCHDGQPIRVNPDAKTFADPSWRMLGFAPTQSLVWRYRIDVSPPQDGEVRVVLTADGDPNCDGVVDHVTRELSLTAPAKPAPKAGKAKNTH